MDLDLTILAIPAFVLLMVAEATITSSRRIHGYEPRDTATSLIMGIGNVLLNLVMKSAHYVFLAMVANYALIDVGTGWLPWLVLLVATDFCYYWFHRLHHEVRFLWAAHVNHHSSRRYNLSTALRQSWTTPFTSLLFYWPLALIGFEPMHILAASALNTVYQFWIHTELIGTMGPLEWIFNTPSHHRVHHGRNIEYLDRNYAGIFIVWDRLFRSFEPEAAAVDYGLTKNIDTYNPLRVAFHEWSAMLRDAARADTWTDAVNYILQPPGWSPDGSTLTAPQMREQGTTAVVCPPAAARTV